MEICLNALIHMVFHSQGNKLRICGVIPQYEVEVDGADGDVCGGEGGVKEGAVTGGTLSLQSPALLL